MKINYNIPSTKTVKFSELNYGDVFVFDDSPNFFLKVKQSTYDDGFNKDNFNLPEDAYVDLCSNRVYSTYLAIGDLVLGNDDTPCHIIDMAMNVNLSNDKIDKIDNSTKVEANSENFDLDNFLISIFQ